MYDISSQYKDDAADHYGSESVRRERNKRTTKTDNVKMGREWEKRREKQKKSNVRAQTRKDWNTNQYVNTKTKPKQKSNKNLSVNANFSAEAINIHTLLCVSEWVCVRVSRSHW